VVKIAVLDDYQGVSQDLADWTRLPADTEVRVFRDFLPDEDTRAGALADFEVIVAMRERTPFPRSLLARLPKLQLLVTTGARNASIDLAAAKEQGVVVSGTRGQRTPTVELTWALILSLARNIAAEDQAMRNGDWQRRIGPGLEGKTLGLLGLGNLGSAVATIGKAFQMELIAWSQNLTAERASQFGARLVTKEQLFAEADIVTIHLILSDRSRGLVGAPELALMKPSAYLVNTSRGPIVSEAALIEALREGRIAGAGLDVYDREPLPKDHPLRSLGNTVLSPHQGYVTSDNYRVFYGDAVGNIAAYLAGEPIRVIE